MGREQLESSVWIYCLTFIYFHKTHTHAHTDPPPHTETWKVRLCPYDLIFPVYTSQLC